MLSVSKSIDGNQAVYHASDPKAGYTLVSRESMLPTERYQFPLISPGLSWVEELMFERPVVVLTATRRSATTCSRCATASSTST